MRKPAAALGSIGFFALAPGVVAGVLPWYLTDGWERRETCYGWLLVPLGATLVAVGGAALVYAFARYVTEGLGTPAPAAPTELVVVGGLNRCVRNPMYLAVVATIIGQSLLLAPPVLLAYGCAVFAAMAAFTRSYEEPMLARRFGAQMRGLPSQRPRWLPHETSHNAAHGSTSASSWPHG
jgi:protein-S-isoprenylcysteine O-methyltransferase Ste14